MKEKLRIVEENGRKYLINTHLKTHRFEIVEKIPQTYEVWNIGDNMCAPDYIPFGIADGNRIKTESLIAIKLPIEDVKILRKVAGYGTTSAQGIKARLRRMVKPEVSRELLEKALIILERITSPAETYASKC